jgi:sec-independent protein translocase protein TatC
MTIFSPEPNQTAGDDSGGRMSFFEHLTELRQRIVSSLIGIGIGAAIGITFSKRIINFITVPMQKALLANHLDPNLYYRHPAGYVSLWINLGIYMGIVIAMPWVLFQIWKFVAPGLHKNERGAAAGFIISSMFLFICGITFGYFIMLPQILNFLVGFGSTGPIKPLIDIDDYFNLILIILVGLGVIFELPVLIFILSLFGIVTPKFLLKNFRYAMLLITVAAAILTPTPDATTMLVFMAPMIVLYFVGVIVSYVVVRRKRERALASGEAT